MMQEECGFLLHVVLAVPKSGPRQVNSQTPTAKHSKAGGGLLHVDYILVCSQDPFHTLQWRGLDDLLTSWFPPAGEVLKPMIWVARANEKWEGEPQKCIALERSGILFPLFCLLCYASPFLFHKSFVKVFQYPWEIW